MEASPPESSSRVLCAVQGNSQPRPRHSRLSALGALSLGLCVKASVQRGSHGFRWPQGFWMLERALLLLDCCEKQVFSEIVPFRVLLERRACRYLVVL